MEEYMRILMEQIRCKKALPYIKEEIQGHIEAQIEDNMAAGMSREKAEKAAVEDMGSPVEAGIALDRIHRPKINWRLIGLMALIGVAGIVLHELMWIQQGLLAGESRDFPRYTLIGFALMLIVYRIDYSVIARFAKMIAAVMIGVCVVALFQGDVIGGTCQLRIFGWNVSLFFPMLLYVPLYGAVIYKYYGQGYNGLFKAILWMLIPVVIAFHLPQLMLSILLLVSMMTVLTAALAHDWFRVAKKRVIAMLWSLCIGVPYALLIFAAGFGMLETHQIARIRAFLGNTDNQGANYMTWMLREILKRCRFIGQGLGNWDSGKELMRNVVECDTANCNTGYVFSYILHQYGILAGIVLCCALAILIAMIFRISFKQKNQLAMCMGCGCGMILGLNAVINIAENIGLLPVTETFFPFFSNGRISVLVCYVLMGIILSIYRYKNIYPAQVDTKLPAVKISVNL